MQVTRINQTEQKIYKSGHKAQLLFDNLLHAPVVEHTGERKQKKKGWNYENLPVYASRITISPAILETVSSNKKDKAFKKVYDIKMSYTFLKALSFFFELTVSKIAS